MKKLLITTFVFLFIGILAKAETWDDIVKSKKYYYGVGVAATAEEADKAAMADMVSQIATNVSSDFKQIDDITNKNGKIEHQSRVLNCVKTYSQTTLTNAEKWGPEGKAPNITVRRYMKKSELARIFDNRIARAKNLLRLADDCLADKKIDMALQYNYWAYSLLRSVQFPNEVKDENGKILIDWIPVKIERILSDISVTYNKKDEDYTYFHFKYKGEPVSSLEFSYSDGRTQCQGRAQYGDGFVVMVPDYATNTYHLDIEYQYISQARGDDEVESVLSVITPRAFSKASLTIVVPDSKIAPDKDESMLADTPTNHPVAADFDISDEPEASESPKTTAQEYDSQSKIVAMVMDALARRQYSSASSCFTIDGLQMFNRLTGYGQARVLDDSNIRYYKGLGGRTIARGLKMAFSFNGRRKKTFVEDISFTFDENNKIENVAFGLGETTENGIFNKDAKWSPEVREIITSFMENYKTAYSLERLDYIRDIFADDAVIIVGNVVKRRTSNPKVNDGMSLSLKGQDIINYNHYTKSDYISQLAKCFNCNDFINLKFTNHQIQWLEKFDKQTIFAINIRQEYNSSTYADDGYLFLLVDMTNHDEPLIKVRTWQPNEVAVDKLYNAGDFFND